MSSGCTPIRNNKRHCLQTPRNDESTNKYLDYQFIDLRIIGEIVDSEHDRTFAIDFHKMHTHGSVSKQDFLKINRLLETLSIDSFLSPEKEIFVPVDASFHEDDKGIFQKPSKSKENVDTNLTQILPNH